MPKAAIKTAALVTLTLLCSCAAHVARGPFIVPIDSTPRGAVVTQAGRGIGTTPCTVSVTNETPILLLELDGYAPREVDLGMVGNGEYVMLGILLWGPIEILVAIGNDAWSRINDDPVAVKLGVEPLPRWERPPPPPREHLIADDLRH